MKIRFTYVLLFMALLLPYLYSEALFNGSLVITRKSLVNGSLKAMVLNLLSGTVINTEKKKFQLSKEELDELNGLLKRLEFNGGNLDFRNSSVPSEFIYFMANTQFGKSIVWQDGSEGNNSVLSTIESYFETYAS